MPALLTRMSTCPAQSTVSSTMRWTGSIVIKSASIVCDRPPIAAIRSAVSAMDERPTQVTRAPAPARATAMPCPSPVLAPVTIAVFPVRSKRFMVGPWLRLRLDQRIAFGGATGSHGRPAMQQSTPLTFRSGHPDVDRYLTDGYETVRGMSSRFAAVICGHVIRRQSELGVSGHIAEIGTFEG